MFSRFKLFTRMVLFGALIAFLYSSVFTYVLPTVKQKLIDAKYLKTRHVVETAWGVLDYYSKLAKKGTLSVEEAKQRAKEAVKSMRYEKDDYFWINDMEPRMVMHPFKPDLDGKDLSGYKDPNGKALFVEFANTVKHDGAGFVDYYWPKPGHSKPVPKISYVKGFPEWGWIIGSGIYINDVETEVNRLLRSILIFVVLLGMCTLVLAYFIARSIAKPINDSIVKLDMGAGFVASASSQVSASSHCLAEGASEHAACLEQTSSAIEEMASMTKQNADNSQQANEMMHQTIGVANEAELAMKDLTKSMDEISQASNETAKIIKTIDEIAFQTNLLALNAAVEAARAGEAGAGFAVVADEVRNLAMRAAEAARTTASLIEGTVNKIKTGSELVLKTNDSFGRLAGGAKKIGDLIGEITIASQEQAQGIEQINSAVLEMDKVIQKNAAIAEESASASQEMSAQAKEMKDSVADLTTLVHGSGARSTDAADSAAMRKEKDAGKKAAPAHPGDKNRENSVTAPQIAGFNSRVSHGNKHNSQELF